ncbi:MAG: type II secretion system protein GspG [Candidatus Schekmanbacteria bacterium]|nr:type II secretion system protein GspG [Candidatus Schekmanbacteria bacterium]
MNPKNRESGFTLIEIVVILAVIAIIAASMVPRISGIIDDAKIARAQSEVQTVGMAILRFNANTGKWPAKNGDGEDNKLYTLVSGSASIPVPIPAYAGGGDTNYFGSDASVATGDYLDNHLKMNSPKGSADNAYPTTGVNRWNGPYLQEVGADPWGNAYVVNIISSYDNNTEENLYCYVISAGPDGTIQTDSDVTAAEVATHAVSGDDIAFLLRSRR